MSNTTLVIALFAAGALSWLIALGFWVRWRDQRVAKHCADIRKALSTTPPDSAQPSTKPSPKREEIER